VSSAFPRPVDELVPAVREWATELGELPSRNKIKQRYRVGADKANAVLAILSETGFDPADPTPTVGGRLLSPEGGYCDDSRLAQRADVLTFTGEPLQVDLYVVGSPMLQLSHSCDNRYNDLFVRISEVDARGHSRNVSDGYLRATPDSRNVRIELDAVAYRFKAGSRIRVLIAGGSHPRFARNLGTGEPLISGRRLAAATHTVHLGEGGTSRLVLPAGPRLP